MAKTMCKVRIQNKISELCTFKEKYSEGFSEALMLMEFDEEDKLYEQCNSSDIIIYINVQRFRWAGHVQRAAKDYPPRQIMHAEIYGVRQ